MTTDLEIIRTDLRNTAEEMHRLTEYMYQLADFGSSEDLKTIKKNHDLTLIKQRVGQIKYRLRID